jgi:hypothetical protein
MRMMRFKSADGFRLGVVVGDALADLSAIQPNAPRDLADFCNAGPPFLPRLRTRQGTRKARR